AIHEAGEDRGVAYIAMELLRGSQLAEHTLPGHLLPPAIAMEIVARLADALHYAHQHQVVHRDIKPGNVMFDAPSGELKIMDFGVARLADTGRTRAGVVLGTPSYMSPEQLQGRPVTGHSDLFSLGVSLFQLLTGQLPFRGDSMPSIMLRIAQEPHPRIRSMDPSLPMGLDEFFERALAKDPADRHADGAAFAVALRDVNQPRRRAH
ncbi:MAG: serine/threonine-protein kinase, partial [Steroidobacteraceae bacterium]